MILQALHRNTLWELLLAVNSGQKFGRRVVRVSDVNVVDVELDGDALDGFANVVSVAR